MSSDSGNGIEIFATFLESTFSSDDLRKFIARHPDLFDVSDVDWEQSGKAIAWQVASALAHRGLHGSFFDDLISVRPHRAHEINAIRKLIGWPGGQELQEAREALEEERSGFKARMIAARQVLASAKGESLKLSLYIDPGNADAEEIQEVLAAINDLHRAHGGLGYRFEVDGLLVRTMEGAVL